MKYRFLSLRGTTPFVPSTPFPLSSSRTWLLTIFIFFLQPTKISGIHTFKCFASVLLPLKLSLHFPHFLHCQTFWKHSLFSLSVLLFHPRPPNFLSSGFHPHYFTEFILSPQFMVTSYLPGLMTFSNPFPRDLEVTQSHTDSPSVFKPSFSFGFCDSPFSSGLWLQCSMPSYIWMSPLLSVFIFSLSSLITPSGS